MRPMTIRYVKDMEAARRFYLALGLTHDFTSRKPRRGPSMWTELAGTPGTGLALHYVPEGSGIGGTGAELCFQAEEPLEDVVERLRAAGYEPETDIVDESFGRAFTIRDPEGLLVAVNENDYELQS
jgi:catechol 2,3-dioxygenase-like lactoylglutathione lyase family enzyme